MSCWTGGSHRARTRPISTNRSAPATFSDLYSGLTFRPRSWITLESQVRYDINNGWLNLAYHQITFTPNERWSWGLGHMYTRAGFVDNGDNLITSTMFLRVNDNWGFRTEHDFNATGRAVAGSVLHRLSRPAELDRAR